DLESYQKLLEKDLQLTEQCVRVNPKSYGSWHLRIWILDNLPKPDWNKELNLCTKYLQLDERNFHCWDYRRMVTERSNVSHLSEYEFTLT
ncbi:RAB geranylgeranyl transferase alpha subunit, putative, partial [Pediculus humanus corporis]